jgi:hypothetical protein
VGRVLGFGPTTAGAAITLTYRIVRGICKRLIALSWFESAVHLIVRVHREKPLNLGGSFWRRIVRTTPIVFQDGYYVHDREALVKHRERVLHLLRPLRRYDEASAQFMARARERADVLVGLHVRHGDYSTWKDGRFYFSWQEYAEIARRVRVLFTGSSVRFVVFSNAEFEWNAFAGIDAVPGPGGLMEDLLALSLCDYIVGPPSSFSRWAAFRGNVPLCVLDRERSCLTAGSFKSVLESPWLSHEAV